MDGSKYVPGMESSSDATRVALTVDRDAVGLMKHASQIGHLAEWWLQGAAAEMPPLAAMRLGRKLERLRLAARLAEGRSSRQVQSTLDTLRQEFLLHSPPKEILAELDNAARESSRLAAASKPPPTIFQEAFAAEPAAPVEVAKPPPRRSRAPLLLLTLVLAAAAGAAAWLQPELVSTLVARVLAFGP